MDDKYIELLINKCTDLANNKVLFISYDKEIKPFIEKIIDYVKKMGVEDIYLDCVDKYLIHDLLINMSYEDMDNSLYFNKKIWDEYAKRKASFLIFETEIPHLMDDVSPEKLSYAAKLRRNTKPLYIKLVERCQIPWCIAAYPGEKWARNIFGDNIDSYDKLKNCIFDMCMVNKDNPSREWDNLLDRNDKIVKKLNNLGLEKIHYYNSMGTDLEVYLPDNYLFGSARDNNIIVNMPSYEVFTSPIYNKTNGIVYNSKPLVYGGGVIDNFWIKFENGKVIDYDSKYGKEILKEIIYTDDKSCYLGEVALVDFDSPISKMSINFGTTLIDENASCHLALGSGFPECISNGLDMSDDDLLKNGINVSKQHVDFMIGTDDLAVVGYTKDGKEVSIFENGNFSKVLR